MLTLPPRASRLAGPSFFQQTGRGLGVRGPARYVGGQLFTRRGASLLLVGCLPEFCRAEARRFTASCPTLTASCPTASAPAGCRGSVWWRDPPRDGADPARTLCRR